MRPSCKYFLLRGKWTIISCDFILFNFKLLAYLCRRFRTMRSCSSSSIRELSFKRAGASKVRHCDKSVGRSPLTTCSIWCRLIVTTTSSSFSLRCLSTCQLNSDTLLKINPSLSLSASSLSASHLHVVYPHWHSIWLGVLSYSHPHSNVATVVRCDVISAYILWVKNTSLYVRK